MSRIIQPRGLVLSLVILFLFAMAGGSAASQPEAPLIQRAAPDPVRQARSVAWLATFDKQRPALQLVLLQLARQRENWRMEVGVERCQRARRALAAVDRGELLAVSDYPLLSSLGSAFDELDGAIRACSQRRYFEFDYRLDLARRSLSRATTWARSQVGTPARRLPSSERIEE